MPEGPTLYLTREDLHRFIGKKIIAASGNADIDMHLLENKKVLDIRTYGKQLFICLKGITIRVHFLMFGKYSINEKVRKASSIKLKLEFTDDTLYFYTSSIKILEGPLEDIFDFSADVMSDEWNPASARKKLKKMGDTMACDALLDQTLFAGVGNIIKNEVLYRVKLHPEALISEIPSKKLGEMIREARVYAFEFLEWKRKNVLSRHWLAYSKKVCKRCDLPFVKKDCGKTNRTTFFCENCQVR